MFRRVLLAGLVALSPVAVTGAAKADGVQIFARDGAAVTFPEGTLAAFDLAIAQGADGLRVDVYQTADGVQVIRTARNLALTTDAAGQITPAVPPKGEPPAVGNPVDLTFYADYARLTALQPIAGRSHDFDGMFPAPILEDLLVLVERRKIERRRKISLLLVLHDTQVHANRGKPMEPRLLATLQKYGLTGSPDVLIGTSEPSSFSRLGATGGNPRVFVLGTSTERPGDAAATGDRRSFGDYQTPEGLRTIRNFADAVLVDVQDVQGTYADGGAMPATTIVDDARAAGLQLFVGGFADAEDPVKPRREALAMYRRIIALGVDAIVTDEPARADAARRNGH